MLLLAVVWPVAAAAADDEPRKSPPWRETWVGAETARKSWSFYSGVTFAPFGSIHENGWRARLTGGTGQFRYAGTRSIEGTAAHIPFRGTSSFADALVGYQWTRGPLILKAFAGVAAHAEIIDPYDPEHMSAGLDIGLKLAAEAWWTIGPRLWSSLDVAWTNAHDQASARARLGYRLWPVLSVGLETGLARGVGYEAIRAGGFARLESGWGEFALSGGALDDGAGAPALYGTALWLLKY